MTVSCEFASGYAFGLTASSAIALTRSTKGLVSRMRLPDVSRSFGIDECHRKARCTFFVEAEELLFKGSLCAAVLGLGRIFGGPLVTS